MLTEGLLDSVAEVDALLHHCLELVRPGVAHLVLLLLLPGLPLPAWDDLLVTLGLNFCNSNTANTAGI